VSCPTLFIHGKSDEVIPWTHSLELINKCTCAAKLVTPEAMKHNNFDVKNDVINHIKDFIFLFIEKVKRDYKCYVYETNPEEGDDVQEESIHFPIFMFTEPEK
jgi:hypothetical protein